MKVIIEGNVVQGQDNSGDIFIGFHIRWEFPGSVYGTTAYHRYFVRVFAVAKDILTFVPYEKRQWGETHLVTWESKKQEKAIVDYLCEIAGGKENLLQMIKNGQPTNRALLTGLLNNDGTIEWVGKSAQAVAA